MRVLFFLIVVVSIGFGSTPWSPAKAQGIEFWNTECKKLLKQYKSKPGHKAFAASNPNTGSGNQACGISWGAGSKKEAEETAVKACKSQRSGTCWVTRSE
jgi:hypothetical protein